MEQKQNATLKGHWTFTLRNIETGEVEVHEYDNIIPDVGLAMIANNLTDATPTDVMLITHAALGSGTTPPAAGDTTLETETYRNAVASMTNASKIAYATAYFNQTETTGTYREAALFSNGTGAANSGVLLSHVAINVTKTNVQTLTIDWSLSLTSA